MLRLLLAAVTVAFLALSPARAHDLPGELSVTGFFDQAEGKPRLALRVPLVMLTNLNLPKRGPGYLDLARIGPDMERAEAAVARAFRISADGVPLEPLEVESRISLPSERTFESFESATAAILGPDLPASQNIFWNQGYFDVLMQFPSTDGPPHYSLLTELPPGMAERTLITLGIAAPSESQRMLTIEGSTGEIALDPAWWQAGGLFLTKGVEHILIGTDHLLFLICLILPLRREPRRLIGVVTAFTLGHSMTLIPAALGFVPSAPWFLPAVETLIAVSIVYMAAENILGMGTRLRWRIAFVFGLIHGFGFASTLTGVMQFAGGHLLSSLVFFNIGIELGQVLVLAAVLPVLMLLFRTPAMERGGVIVISLLAGHEAWHWATERAAGLGLATAAGPEVYGALTWVAVALVAVIVLWWAAAHGRTVPPPHRREAGDA